MAQSQFGKIDEYGFERPEDFDYAAYELYVSQYFPILAKRSKKWTRSMASGRALRSRRTLKINIRKGIPNEFREKVWMYVSGAEEQRSKLGPQFYKQMVAAPHDPAVIEAIKIDLHRTFPENIFFKNTVEDKLFRVLSAHACYNKKIGYCQGMNYIAGLILLVTKNEESTFWLLKALVENLLPDYFGPTMDGLLTDIDALSELVRLKFPEVSRHVSELGLPWPIIVTKWFVCIYSEVLPRETVLRVWDCLFNEGSKILFRVGLTVIGLHLNEILSATDLNELKDCLNGIVKSPSVLHCHDFIQKIFKVPGKLTSNQLYRIRQRVTIERKQMKKDN